MRKLIQTITGGIGEEDLSRHFVLHGKVSVVKFKTTAVINAKLKHRDKIFSDGRNVKEIMQSKGGRRKSERRVTNVLNGKTISITDTNALAPSILFE